MALEYTMAFQEEKMLFKWVKLGFTSGDAIIKKEAQMLATNVMQSKHEAYEEVSVK